MSMPIIMLFVVMAICFIIRMPVSFSMLAASITYFLLAAPDKLGQVFTVITGNMFANYTMLAAPLFIFMANVLNEGEVTDKLFSFCNGLLGRLKGGTAQVNVFISLIFSGMTGSAIADASGIGLMEIDQMKKEGYDAEFSCAITAASATVGPIFPPSIPMVIYAMLSGASIGKLFMGGMVPGVLLAILLMIYVAFISHKRNYPAGVVMSKREFLKSYIAGSSGTVYSCYSSWWNLFRYLYSYRGWCCCFCIRTDHFCTDLQNTGMEKALGYHQEIRCQHSYTGSPLRNFHAVLLHHLSGAGSESCCKPGYGNHR